MDNADAVFNIVSFRRIAFHDKLANLPQRLPLHFPFFKTQQLVAVVVVLFFAGGQLGGQLGQLGGQLGEGVQNADDFGLDF